jgi:hypothetical protein
MFISTYYERYKMNSLHTMNLFHINGSEPMSKTIFEEFKVAGEDLVKRVKELIREGNVRKLVIKNKKGEKLLDTSLTFGASGIGALIWLTPFIAAVTFVALMVTEATIVVERDATYDEKEVEAEDIEVVED